MEPAGDINHKTKSVTHNKTYGYVPSIGAGAEWAAWLPATCQVGRSVHRPGGPSRQMLKEGVKRGAGALS